MILYASHQTTVVVIDTDISEHYIETFKKYLRHLSPGKPGVLAECSRA